MYVLQSKIFAGFFSAVAESWKNLKDNCFFIISCVLELK